MKCAIHQPQFLPWLGYLSKINSADVFVFLDNVQFKKNEYQNRNKIRVGDEAKWITVPVSFTFGDTIRQVRIAGDPRWHRKLHMTIEHSYGKAPYFARFAPGLLDVLDQTWENLADLNQATVEWLMKCFEIKTKVLVCSNLPEFSPDPTQRLVDICKYAGADTYLSGAGGRNYLDVKAFENAGIKLEFQEYLHPEYPQCYSSGGFLSHLSAVDALFNCGGGVEVAKQLNL